jgi:hypothetical protein
MSRSNPMPPLRPEIPGEDPDKPGVVDPRRPSGDDDVAPDKEPEWNPDEDPNEQLPRD